MKPSEAIIGKIMKFEGLRQKAYLCPAGVWTIGYGHTGPDVHSGKIITAAEARALLEADLSKFTDFVNSEMSGVPLAQNQFDALVSFAFNVGTPAFHRSKLRRLVRENPNNPAIRAEFNRWIYARGKVLVALRNRRKIEADHYFGSK